MKLKEGSLDIKKEKSKLDEIVIKFARKLSDLEVKYVVVSGYVAILTGRTRGTENIDIIMENLKPEKLKEILEKLKNSGYWCINAEISNAYRNLASGTAVRLAEEGRVIPNFEINLPMNEIDRETLENSLKAKIYSEEINISPLEIQIGYKLYLGSEKDWEDALHLYKIFEKDLDQEKIEEYAKKMEVGDKLDELREA